MKKAVIFDLDGTLLYTLEDLADSVNYALSLFGLCKCSVEQVRSFVGNGVESLMRKAVSIENGLLSEIDFQNCLRVFKEHYRINMRNKTCPYDGVVALLKVLKIRGMKIAVVSNKFDIAVKDLCEFYFGYLIDIAVGESVNIAKKPAPDGVFSVIKEFDLSVEDCIYIGDSEVDIQTAKNAKMDCILVDWGYKDRNFLQDNGARFIVSSVSELQNALLNK